MRSSLAAVAAVAAAVAFTTIASPASADDPNVTYLQGGTTGSSRTLSCQTQYKPGILGQYGAWGYYVDGCTVKLDCPAHTGFHPTRYCLVLSSTYIDTAIDRGDQVTMNARIRRFDSGGSVYGWSDKSCAGVDRCTTQDNASVSPGQSASVQCNGVRQARPYDGNAAKDFCSIELRYR